MIYKFEVEAFIYNGFAVNPPSGGWGQKAPYRASFVEWTNDAGIALCNCSDGEQRLIPSCQLKGNQSQLPKQTYGKLGGSVLFGTPSQS